MSYNINNFTAYTNYMKKVLIIDNYDSFTYNLVHYLEELNCHVTVFRNDEFDLEEVNSFNKIILSPGPGLPNDAGLLIDLIKKYYTSKSILGICLGHQAIGEAFGAKLKNLKKVYHGIATTIYSNQVDEKLFDNIPESFNVGRYHSWVIDRTTLPVEISITSVDENQEIMSIKHIDYDLRGVQFHPESILTQFGKELLKNWLDGSLSSEN
jgi:anthranilate synthase component II